MISRTLQLYLSLKSFVSLSKFYILVFFSPERGGGGGGGDVGSPVVGQGVGVSERDSLEAGEHGIDSNETGEMHVHVDACRSQRYIYIFK